MPTSLPSQKELLKYFSYNPETGVVTRTKTTSSRSKAGDIVGSVDCRGYVHVMFEGKFYQLHRLIYKMETGRDPQGTVDHDNEGKVR